MKTMFNVGLLLTLAMFAAGCGGPDLGTPVKIKGKVTVAGAAPKDMNIIFQGKGKLPADKRTAFTALKPDGTYEIDNLYPAEYDVLLQSTAPPDASGVAVPLSAAPVTEMGTPVMKPATVAKDKTEHNFEF